MEPQIAASDARSAQLVCEETRRLLGFSLDEKTRSVVFHGQHFRFGKKRWKVVLLLYESHKQKAPEMAADLIIDRSGESGSRLREMFKRHRAWGKVIVMTRPAYYRPNLP